MPPLPGIHKSPCRCLGMEWPHSRQQTSAAAELYNPSLKSLPRPPTFTPPSHIHTHHQRPPLTVCGTTLNPRVCCDKVHLDTCYEHAHSRLRTSQQAAERCNIGSCHHLHAGPATEHLGPACINALHDLKAVAAALALCCTCTDIQLLHHLLLLKDMLGVHC